MKAKITNKSVLLFLLFLPFFKPPGFSEYKMLGMVFDALFVIAMVYITYRVIVLGKKHRFTKCSLINVLLQAYIFLRTLPVSGIDTSVIRNTVGYILLTFLMEFYSEKNKELMCRTIVLICSMWSIINLIIGYGVLFETYFFGQRTNLTVIGFPMMFLSVFFYLYFRKKYYKWNAIIIILSNGFMILKESVSTAIVGIGLTCVIYYFLRKFQKKDLDGRYLVIGAAIYNFIAINTQNFDYAKVLIENILGESMTLTGRTAIWDNTMSAFIQQPIFGYGYRQLIVSRGLYATPTAYVHNGFLQFCVDGGIIALILFLLLMSSTVKKIEKNKYSQFYLAALLASEVVMISEIPTSYSYFYCFIIFGGFLFSERMKIG